MIWPFDFHGQSTKPFPWSHWPIVFVDFFGGQICHASVEIGWYLKKTIAHWTRTFVHHPPPEIQQSSEKSPIAGQHQVQADSGGSRGGSCPGYCDHHPSLIYGCCNIGHPTSVHVSLLSVHMFLLPSPENSMGPWLAATKTFQFGKYTSL